MAPLHSISSPAESSAITVVETAAMPDPKTSAASACSSTASLASADITVGLP